jgi:hypothetical protein
MKLVRTKGARKLNFGKTPKLKMSSSPANLKAALRKESSATRKIHKVC